MLDECGKGSLASAGIGGFCHSCGGWDIVKTRIL